MRRKNLIDPTELAEHRRKTFLKALDPKLNKE